MDLAVLPFTEQEAAAMCSWHYPAPYNVYDCPDWKTVHLQNWAMINAELRQKEFYAVYAQEEFVGFFRLRQQEESILIGLGLRPDCCGQGMGKQLLALVLNTAQTRFPSISLQMEVRSFNQRAIRCYEQAGFRVVQKYRRKTAAGMTKFLRMEYVGQ